jgi:hypothetical protein
MKATLLLSSMLIAGTAFGSSCVTGSLDSYINLGSGGCNIGAVSLSGFTVAAGQNGTTPINPSQVVVTPGGFPLAPIVTFALSTTSTAPAFLESFFRFQAFGPGLVGNMLSLNSGSATGDGVSTALEYICPGASFSANAPVGCPGSSSLVTFADSSSSQLSDFASFPPTSFSDIFVDLSADGGVAGSATFGSATVQFTAIPEPTATLLIITGFAMLTIGSCLRKAKN